VASGQWPVGSGQWPVGGRAMGRSYRDLIAWQKSMNLAESIYHLTAAFPSEERFGLVTQMRRCAVSVPSNSINTITISQKDV
jgi:23S rRNA-intervening sequence protein